MRPLSALLDQTLGMADQGAMQFVADHPVPEQSTVAGFLPAQPDPLQRRGAQLLRVARILQLERLQLGTDQPCPLVQKLLQIVPRIPRRSAPSCGWR